jgi:hypothetical protein
VIVQKARSPRTWDLLVEFVGEFEPWHLALIGAGYSTDPSLRQRIQAYSQGPFTEHTFGSGLGALRAQPGPGSHGKS